ncbi:MAG TPA: TAXI family TRAP transporter solute-binding subunit [Kineosporiaceae bacterium]|nr:TAXI family TRAP transporter solute-binding subunit [Kineosporiaceae bacterium]
MTHAPDGRTGGDRSGTGPAPAGDPALVTGPGTAADLGPVTGSGPAAEGVADRVRDRSRRLLLLGGAAAAAAGTVGLLLRDRTGPPVPASLVLATGPQGAVFVEVGNDLANAIRGTSPGTSVRVLVTAATVDNLGLLAERRADLAFGALDAVVSDDRVRTGSITALCRLYDSFLHLVVLDGSPIRALTDLAGHRVAVGAAGSGTEFSVTKLLQATGIRPAALPRMGQNPAMDALAAGSVDAAFSLTGFPTPAITKLAGRQRIRLVPLGDYFRTLDGAVPRVYGPGPIPEGTYPEVPSTESVYVPNVLLARSGLPDEVVTFVIGVLLSAQSRRYWVHPDSSRINVRSAIATGQVGLHPAAVTWLRDHKP